MCWCGVLVFVVDDFVVFVVEVELDDFVVVYDGVEVVVFIVIDEGSVMCWMY